MMLDLADWIERAASDRVLAWHGRGLSLRLAVKCGRQVTGLLIAAKPRVLAGEEIESVDIEISGQRAAFDRLAADPPPPGHHSFGALLRHDTGIAIRADAVHQAQALAALERLIELAIPGKPDAGRFGCDQFGFDHDVGPITGSRRVLRTAGGREAMIHWIEAGMGPPMVLLHTAGADSRQYLHQLADVALQRRYRMIAFDLPWHGLSSGEDGSENTVGYTLAEAAYFDWCVAVLEQVAGSPAIIMGCSMGATMGLTLTARRADLVAGCIALEAPMSAPGRRSDLLTDARVADSQHNPAYVRAMLGPASPARRRDEACAIYAQGRPGVYMGDLAYYSEEYDGSTIVPGLRACGRPLVFLTGSYDYSASPANTRRLFRAIGAKRAMFREMPGLGHFPMIEDPERFRPHFLDALSYLERPGR